MKNGNSVMQNNLANLRKTISDLNNYTSDKFIGEFIVSGVKFKTKLTISNHCTLHIHESNAMNLNAPAPLSCSTANRSHNLSSVPVKIDIINESEEEFFVITHDVYARLMGT